MATGSAKTNSSQNGVSGSTPSCKGQDLGADFHFERDPMALASILNNGGLTPHLKPKAFQSTLNPVAELPPRFEKYGGNFDFFVGRNGHFFYRPRSVTKGMRKLGSNNNSLRMGYGHVGENQRGIPLHHQHAAKVNGHADAASSNLPRRMQEASLVKSEKKLMPFMPLPHRESISERKAIPGLEDGRRKVRRSGLPRPVAKRNLQFHPPEDRRQDDANFRKPITVSKPVIKKAVKEEDRRPLVELIMVREGLVGLPRESLSSFLRQSMTKDELNLLLDDDSTQSFEALERRLKTPRKPPPSLKAPLDRCKVTSNDKVKDSLRTNSGGKTVARESRRSHIVTNEETSTDTEATGTVTEAGTTSLAPSLSLTNLQDTSCGVLDAKSPVLNRSISYVDLHDKVAKESLQNTIALTGLMERMAAYRREYEEMEEEFKALMEKTRKRRQEFKLTWGVSPAKINSLRPLKRVVLKEYQINMSSNSPRNPRPTESCTKGDPDDESSVGKEDTASND